MNWKKFAGPGFLAGTAILILVAVNISGNVKYDEGDTVDPGFVQTSCCMGLLSILMCLTSIVWFAFALGMKTEKKVFLARDPGNFQRTADTLASNSRSKIVSSTAGGGVVSYVRGKIVIEKSESDTAQMVGLLIIVGSIAMFALMMLLGFISILMSLGPGLGFSGGTCNNTCESLWTGAVLSKWASILLFMSGLIALARPWSWFRYAEDIHHPIVSRCVANEQLNLEDLTVNELKERLRVAGLPISGKKTDLIARLSEHQQNLVRERWANEHGREE